MRRKNGMKRIRILSILLALVMCLSMMPAGVWAEASDTVVEAKWGTGLNDLENEGTIIAAIEADADYIQLQADVTLVDTTIDHSVTLDLNGKTLVVPEQKTIAINEGHALVVNNTVSATGGLDISGIIKVKGSLDVSSLGYGLGGLLAGRSGGLDLDSGCTTKLMNVWSGVSPNWMKHNNDNFFMTIAAGAAIIVGENSYNYKKVENTDIYAWVKDGHVAVANNGQYYESYATVADAEAAAQEGTEVYTVSSNLIGNNGYPYGKDMYYSKLTLVIEATGALSYQWQKSDVENGNYEDIEGATTETIDLTAPESGTWYRCVVNGIGSKAVQIIKPGSDGRVWTEYNNSTSYYISNGTIAYFVNTDYEKGPKFDVVGLYKKENTEYMLQTSYSETWSMYSSTDSAVTEMSYSSGERAKMDALKISFAADDEYAVLFEADLADGQRAFAFGCDTQLGNYETSGSYSDDAALVATIGDNVLEKIAMVGAESEALAKSTDPAFVIAPDISTPATKFWVGYYLNRYIFAYNEDVEGSYKTHQTIKTINGTKIVSAFEGEDSGMTMSWLNVTPGGSVKFIFKVGSVADTGAVSGSSIDSPTGNIKLSLSKKATSIKILVDGNELSSEKYTITGADTITPIITFRESAGLTHESDIVVEVIFTGQDSTQTIKTLDVDNNIPEPPTTYTITVTSDGNGNASASPAVTVAGVEITLTATPDDGYRFKEWQVLSGGVSITDNKFEMPESNVEVMAIFEEIPAEPPAPPTPPIPPSSSDPTVITVPVKGEENKVNVEATVSGSTADVKIDAEEIQQVIHEEAKTGIVEVDLTGLGKNINSAKLPIDVVEDIVEAAADEANDVEGMTIKLSTGEVEFDKTALAAVVEQADGNDIQIHVDNVGISRLNAEQKKSAEDLDVVAGYEAYITCNGQRISDFSGGKATVTLSPNAMAGRNPRGFKVWYLAENGSREKLHTYCNGTTVMFSVPHFSDYIVAYDEAAINAHLNCPKDETCPIWPFKDTKINEWYHDGIHYCIDTGLMNGIAADQFNPDGATTRGMLMTILARMSGVDTTGSDPWYQAGLDWAVANEVSDGTNPEAVITREQLVTMLYRNAGTPTAYLSSLDGFADAESVSSWAKYAMAWAVESGIVTGMGENTLAPQMTTPRCQMAAMLQRYDALVDM